MLVVMSGHPYSCSVCKLFCRVLEKQQLFYRFQILVGLYGFDLNLTTYT